MTDEDALFRAIVDSPDDDTLRLVYADWLEEHGLPERAEFMRAQIELAMPVLRGTRTRRQHLERRIKVLWKQFGPEWAKQPGGGSEQLQHWARGFCAHYYAKEFATLAAELPRRLHEAPIQHVRLGRTRREDVVNLVALSLLSRLRSLTLFAAPGRSSVLLGDADMHLLGDCQYLTRLEALDLTQHTIGPEGLRQLAQAPGLPALRDLMLYGNPCGNEALRVLARSPLAARLRKLHMGGDRNAPLTAAGARVLAKTPTFANLRVLNFDNSTIRDAGAQYIAGAAHFSGLTELWLHSCEIRDNGVKAIAASPHLANLEILDLSTNWTVGHAAAVALVESPYLKKIRYLDLWRCESLSRADEKLLRKRFRSRVNFARSY